MTNIEPSPQPDPAEDAFALSRAQAESLRATESAGTEAKVIPIRPDVELSSPAAKIDTQGWTLDGINGQIQAIERRLTLGHETSKSMMYLQQSLDAGLYPIRDELKRQSPDNGEHQAGLG